MGREFSFSQISSYKSCKLKWYFGYVVGIEPKRLRPTISFGSCGHAILEASFTGKDLKSAAEKWSNDLIDSSNWFDEEIEEIKVIAEEALRTVEHYLLYHPEDRSWVIMDVEKEYNVSIEGMAGIRIKGYLDVVIREEEQSKNLWVVEHKFPKSLKEEENLDLVQQLKMYDWAARKIYKGLGFTFKGCIYNQILGKAPKIPSLNKNGTMSKAAISTTWDVYSDCLIKAGLDPVEYIDMKEKLDQKHFWQRNKVLTSEVERKNFVMDLKKVIWEMTKKSNHIYGAYSYICDDCEFKELCIEHLKGGDVEFIIENNYRKRKPKQ